MADPASPPGETSAYAEEKLSFELGENREILAEFFSEAADHLLQVEAALLALERQPGDLEALNAIFRSFHTIKGNAGFLGLSPMHALAHEVETLLDLARNHRIRLNPLVITLVLRSRDALQALNAQVGEALASGRLPEQIIQVGPLVAAVRRLAAAEGASAELAAPASRAKPAGPHDEPASASHAAPTVRVRTEKLDALMDVVGELAIVQSQLAETARRVGSAVPLLTGNVAQLGRIAKELQVTAMSLRMVPIQPIFQKMERLARDLARECGKTAELSTFGGDTELDRTMVEEIADPLVHMMRNALDHGIEPPGERIARGKPEAGSITLKAYHEGSHIVIELQDDGRGLDPERILAKARRQGLVPAGAAPSREEIQSYIFLPGFSTAEQVTSVSGRGVGMDVVKRNVEKLRGKIEIVSEPGSGSTFTIRLPLTMAIIDGLVVRVGLERFIFPSTSVRQALRPSLEAIVAVQGCGEVLDVRGRLFPLHRLRRRLGLPACASGAPDGIALIVESSGKTCAFLVDELINKQEVVIKSLGGFMQGLPGISGAAILGDGAIALIVDPAELLSAA